MDAFLFGGPGPCYLKKYWAKPFISFYMLHAVCGLDRFYLLTSYHSSFDQEAHNNFILNRSVKTRISPSSSLFFKACWLPHVLELTLEKNKSLPPGSLQKKAHFRNPLEPRNWEKPSPYGKAAHLPGVVLGRDGGGAPSRPSCESSLAIPSVLGGTPWI